MMARTMTTTTETITDAQIEALSTEAAQAGDLEMVAYCYRALRDCEEALAVCVNVIADAEAIAYAEAEIAHQARMGTW